MISHDAKMRRSDDMHTSILDNGDDARARKIGAKVAARCGLTPTQIERLGLKS